MKRLLFALSLITRTIPVQGETLLKEKDLLAICGDSITEQKLYSVFIEDYLLMCKPVPSLQSVQFGWSGEIRARI